MFLPNIFKQIWKSLTRNFNNFEFTGEWLVVLVTLLLYLFWYVRVDCIPYTCSEDGLLSTLDQLIGSLAPDSTASDSLREAVRWMQKSWISEIIHLVCSETWQPKSLFLYLQWKKWLLTWTSKERCHNALPEENTALLIVRTVEIVSTRYDPDDHTLNLEYSQLEQITSSICCRLAARVIAQVILPPSTFHSQISSWHID